MVSTQQNKLQAMDETINGFTLKTIWTFCCTFHKTKSKPSIEVDSNIFFSSIILLMGQTQRIQNIKHKT